MRRPQRALDHDGLQADVMRFMAIIAFCLVAILALVRNVEAPPEPTRTAAPVVAQTSPTPASEEAPAAFAELTSQQSTFNPQQLEAPEVRLPSPPQQTVAPTPERAQPRATAAQVDEQQRLAQALSASQRRNFETQRALQAAARSKALEERARRRAQALEQQRIDAEQAAKAPEAAERVARVTSATPPEPAVNEAPAAVVPTPSQPVAASAEPKDDDGLSLRFASEHDFLRLLSSGEVELFLFDGPGQGRALKLGRNFDFDPARPPGQLYELMPSTIPAAISSTARRRVSDVTAYKWGVRMPSHVEAEIRRLVGVARTGSLLIDRHGQVRHENS